MAKEQWFQNFRMYLECTTCHLEGSRKHILLGGTTGVPESVALGRHSGSYFSQQVPIDFLLPLGGGPQFANCCLKLRQVVVGDDQRESTGLAVPSGTESSPSPV